MKLKNSLLKLIGTLLIIAAVVVGIYFLFDNVMFAVFKITELFFPFLVAYLVYIIINPLVNKLQSKVKLPRRAATIIVILLTVGILGGIIFAIGWKILEEIQGVYRQLPQIAESVQGTWASLSLRLSDIYNALPKSVQMAADGLEQSVLETVGNIAKGSSTPLVYSIGNFAKALPSIFIGIIAFILSLYFMTADPKTLRHFLRKLFPKRFLVHAKNVRIELKKYLGGYVKAQLIIMSIASVIILIGLSILKIEYALLIAIAIAFVDALPFFGSGAVLWPWSLISFINGDLTRGFGLIIIYLAVIITRQLIEPKIVSQNIGVYPVFILMSMYVGYRVFSIGGMILGPILLMMVISFYKAGALDGIIGFFAGLFKNLREEIKDLYNYFNKGE